MGDLALLSEAQMRRVTASFPLSRKRARVDRRVLSGILGRHSPSSAASAPA